MPNFRTRLHQPSRPTWLKSAAVSVTCLSALACAFLSSTAPANPTLGKTSTNKPQAEIAKPEGPQAFSKDVKPALWKVSDEDTTIWLFGTIHILPQAVDWYKGPVASALDSADELVTEIPMNGNAPDKAMALKSLREDGRTLRSSLSSHEQQAYDNAMASLGIPLTAFDRNDAWFAALMLTMIPLQTTGYNIANGIDTQVAEKAKLRNLPNIALETAEYQLDLFENLPEESQHKYLLEVIKSLPTVTMDISAIAEAWKTGNAELLAKLMNEDESDRHIRQVLLVDRNKTWSQWLKSRLNQPGTVFVAVGAGHLAGEDSVQDILAAQGITSSRVQ